MGEFTWDDYVLRLAEVLGGLTRAHQLEITPRGVHRGISFTVGFHAGAESATWTVIEARAFPGVSDWERGPSRAASLVAYGWNPPDRVHDNWWREIDPEAYGPPHEINATRAVLAAGHICRRLQDLYDVESPAELHNVIAVRARTSEFGYIDRATPGEAVPRTMSVETAAAFRQIGGEIRDALDAMRQAHAQCGALRTKYGAELFQLTYPHRAVRSAAATMLYLAGASPEDSVAAHRAQVAYDAADRELAELDARAGLLASEDVLRQGGFRVLTARNGVGQAYRTGVGPDSGSIKVIEATGRFGLLGKGVAFDGGWAERGSKTHLWQLLDRCPAFQPELVRDPTLRQAYLDGVLGIEYTMVSTPGLDPARVLERVLFSTPPSSGPSVGSGRPPRDGSGPGLLEDHGGPPGRSTQARRSQPPPSPVRPAPGRPR